MTTNDRILKLIKKQTGLKNSDISALFGLEHAKSFDTSSAKDRYIEIFIKIACLGINTMELFTDCKNIVGEEKKVCGHRNPHDLKYKGVPTCEGCGLPLFKSL